MRVSRVALRPRSAMPVIGLSIALLASAHAAHAAPTITSQPPGSVSFSTGAVFSRNFTSNTTALWSIFDMGFSGNTLTLSPAFDVYNDSPGAAVTSDWALYSNITGNTLQF